MNQEIEWELWLIANPKGKAKAIKQTDINILNIDTEITALLKKRIEMVCFKNRLLNGKGK